MDNRNNHVWQKEIDEISYRYEIAKRMGGEENIERQHRSGRLTARERIDLLLDAGSFNEIGALAGNAVYDNQGNLTDAAPSNLIGGKGKISGHSVVVSADDFTIRGGSSGSASSAKMVFMENYALEHRFPLIRLVDAGGGSVRTVEKLQATYIPGILGWRIADLLATVPVAAAALGPCAGLGAMRVGLSHFSVMVKERSQVFAGGPHVVLPGMKEKISKEELGGYKVHVQGTGVVNNLAENEDDAIKQIQTFLSYMPKSVYHLPKVRAPEDDPNRREDELASIVPRDRRKVYDMRKILKAVFDQNSLFEIGYYWGRSEITMLGRLHGYPVGIVANDPTFYGGAMTAESAEKFVRFLDLCDTFNLPVVNFIDQPGTLVGKEAESKGTVSKTLRALLCLNQISTPFCSIFVRRCFGLAGGLYGPRGPRNGSLIRYAWPSAYWGSVPLEGGVEAAYKREIESADDPVKRRDELLAYYRQFESPFRTAEQFKIEEIIDPRNTRPILCNWIEEAYDILPENLGRKSYTYRM